MSIWLQELILLDVTRKLFRARTPQSIIVILFLLIFFIGIYIASKNYSLYHDARGALPSTRWNFNHPLPPHPARAGSESQTHVVRILDSHPSSLDVA